MTVSAVTSSLHSLPEPVRDLRYSRKGLPVDEKMKKQMRYALQDPCGSEKKTEASFRVRAEPRRWCCCRCSLQKAFSTGAAQYQGKKDFQEDRYIEQTAIQFRGKEQRGKGLLSAVFDGHLGPEAAEYCKKHLKEVCEKALTRQFQTGSSQDESVANAFVETMQHLTDPSRGFMTVGTTVALLFKLKNTFYPVCVGDSRILLVKAESEYQVTEDAAAHKKRFYEWHRKNGNNLGVLRGNEMEVLPRGDQRTPTDVSKRGENEWLSVGRDVGITWMCCRPKITKIEMGEGIDRPEEGILFCKRGDYFIIATDGLTQEATNAEIAAQTRLLIKEGYPPKEIADRLAQAANVFDNVTVIVVAV